MGHEESVGALGEEALVQRLARILGQAVPPVSVGIGDDCAVLRLAGRNTLLATDTMVEGTHFITEPGHVLTNLRAVGWRLGASNLSDIAAMGGSPIAGVISAALPEGWPVRAVDHLYEGLLRVAGQYGLSVCGGDTVRIDGPAAFTLAVLGEIDEEPVLRSGGRPGDLLAVTGTLGESSMCLDQVARQAAPEVSLLQKHLWPRPRLEWGQKLRGHASAMMDLSDGLATDLPRLARASRVGAVIHERELPVSDALVAACGERAAALRRGLVGGEDYELLVALPPGVNPPGVPLTVIGVLTAEPAHVEVITTDGARRPLGSIGGWQHFQGSA